MAFLVKVSDKANFSGWLTESDIDEAQCIGQRTHAKLFRTREEADAAIKRLTHSDMRHSFQYEILSEEWADRPSQGTGSGP